MRFGQEAEVLQLPLDTPKTKSSFCSEDWLDVSLSLFGEVEEEKPKDTMEALDSMLLNSANNVERTPLPPFTVYTGHFSINGIPGHHYHAIAKQQTLSTVPPIEFNSSNDNKSKDSNPVMFISNDTTTGDSKRDVMEGVTDIKLKNENDSFISDEIAELINSAFSDNTAQNSEHINNESKQSWVDSFLEISHPSDTKHYDTLLSPPQCKSEIDLCNKSKLCSSYGENNPISQFSGYPYNLTQDQEMTCYLNRESTPLTMRAAENSPLNDCFIPNQIPNHPSFGLLENPIRSNFIINGNSMDAVPNNDFPRSTKSFSGTKKSRNRGNKRNSRIVINGIGIFGRERPIHRCSICSRGFLNKSNIKVHLRTHTGEKPFSCVNCNKTFRQNAHLVKHEKMHKRLDKN